VTGVRIALRRNRPNVDALRAVDTTKLRLLADWLDRTDRPGQGNEIQTDLRQWARVIDDVLGR
jgi:hypothetical protein